jgi:hypothetical protein
VAYGFIANVLLPYCLGTAALYARQDNEGTRGTIFCLSRKLELAKIVIDHLKKVLNLLGDCTEEFRVVSNS